MSSKMKVLTSTASQTVTKKEQVQRDQKAFREQTKNIVRIFNAKNADR